MIRSLLKRLTRKGLVVEQEREDDVERGSIMIRFGLESGMEVPNPKVGASGLILRRSICSELQLPEQAA
jgi:hypothetical protein